MSTKTASTRKTATALRTARRTVRWLFATVLTFVAAVALGAGTASARVAPFPPEFVTAPTTMTVPTTNFTQLGLVAAVACLVGIVGTIAVQLAVRSAHRSAIAPA